MSGKRFDFDDTAPLSADDMFAFEDATGIPVDGTLEEVGAALEAGEVTSRGIRAVVGLAWLAHRRAGGTLEWRAFCKTVEPGTLEVVPDTGGDGGPQRESATRQRPRPRKKKA